ncbi:MAG: hypothetical protein Q4P15_13095 [Propionibacteriaceae bacterium]|nr:hypothetical protein [Propionibacteriaceae bacterium]
MKRFVSSVMTVVMAFCLTGLALDAQASPGDLPRGDQVVPSENGAGSGGGGDGTGTARDGGNGLGTGSGSGTGIGTGTGGNGGPGGGEPGTGSGSGDPGAVVPGLSTPRLMLSGFTTAPEVVGAGQDFTASFTLRNTSKRTRVQNIKVTMSSGEGAAFLPSNGSSSIFIERISAGDDSIQTMAFHSLPSLEERPYQLTMSVEYEDAVANAYQSQETVSVPVKQTIRADTSAPQVMPEMIQVGQDASVTFNIHNQGKTKLFNAKAVIKDGQPVTGEEIYIGTIEPGSSGAVDMLIRAEAESTEPMVVDVTYEDVDGQVTTLSKEVPLSVMPMEVPEEFPTDEMPMDEGGGFGMVPWIIGLVLLLLLILVIALVRRSRRRGRDRDDMESLSMIGGDPLMPADDLRG